MPVPEETLHSINARLTRIEEERKQAAFEIEEIKVAIRALQIKMLDFQYLECQLEEERQRLLHLSIPSPASKIPNEVLGEIFTRYTRLDGGQSPWPLTAICRTWRGAAFATPALWDRISVDSRWPDPEWARRNRNGRESCHSVRQLFFALARAPSAKLDYVHDGTPDESEWPPDRIPLDQELFEALVIKSSDRWRRLEFSNPSEEWHRNGFQVAHLDNLVELKALDPSPHLLSALARGCPRLRRVHFRAMQALVPLLGQTWLSQLTSLHLHNNRRSEWDDVAALEQVISSCTLLQELILVIHILLPDGDNECPMSQLRLPQLRSTIMVGQYSHISPFLSSSIRHLDLDLSHRNFIIRKGQAVDLPLLVSLICTGLNSFGAMQNFNFPQLRSVLLKDNKSDSIEGLDHVFKSIWISDFRSLHPTRLVVLHVHIPHLSGSSLFDALQHLDSLEELGLESVPVSHTDLAAFQHGDPPTCPNLRRFSFTSPSTGTFQFQEDATLVRSVLHSWVQQRSASGRPMESCVWRWGEYDRSGRYTLCKGTFSLDFARFVEEDTERLHPELFCESTTRDI